MGCNCRKKKPTKEASSRLKAKGASVPKFKQESKTAGALWIKCRASANCDGNTAKKLRSVKGGAHAGFNKITHYRCTKCGNTFAITV